MKTRTRKAHLGHAASLDGWKPYRVTFDPESGGTLIFRKPHSRVELAVDLSDVIQAAEANRLPVRVNGQAVMQFAEESR